MIRPRLKEIASVAAFHPRMTATRCGIAVVGERRALSSEAGLVEIWRARCEAGAAGDYVSLDPRLFVVLAPLQAEIALDGGASGARAASRTISASFVPAGAPIHMSVTAATELRHLDLHFDPERLGPIEGLDGARASCPRLMFSDDRVQRFARLLEAACARPSAPLDLYADGLVAGLVAAAFASPDAPSRRSALSDPQLRRSIEYIEARCAEPIRLQELASVSGLSETYFSHAFKAATGMPPHRWQLQARVRRAKAMLSRSAAPLTEVAVATGFSDQPHFTRVFKALTGTTPSAWRGKRR
jgi:AraC-like DNA-binding protein